jgi:hypothetical protein
VRHSLSFLAAVAAAIALATAPTPALAGDTWTSVAPGIDHLHRIAAGPQDYHVVKIDLRRKEIYLRATNESEKGKRTSTWAASVGAKVAVNGDLWDTKSNYVPVGMASNDGWRWNNDTPDWAYLACDMTKACWYNRWGSLDNDNPHAWTAVGGMQDLLVIDGKPQSYSPSFYSERHPRTASGVTQDGSTLILVVVDGRRSGAIGMTFAELTAVMMEFGAYNALNHDGGGSSTLVIGGAIRNVPSDGSERTVANHLGILISDHTDATCAGAENARVCIDATKMRTCTGGIDRGTGDCGVFGLRCEQTGQFAYCVNPNCKNGGQKNLCLDATHVGMCKDGVYSEGDCAAFGLSCVSGIGNSWCYSKLRKAEAVASSLGSPQGGELTVAPGGTAEVWFEVRNTGQVPFDPGKTRLAPLPRDKPSPLAAPGWISPSRAASVAAAAAPGATGRFTFSIRAPDTAGDHKLALGLLEEGVTWFADEPAGGGFADGTLAVTLHVVQAPAGQGDGPGPARDGGSAEVDERRGAGSCSYGAGEGAPPLELLLLALVPLVARRRRLCGW